MSLEKTHSFEGTWEEIVAHADELQTHRLKLIVLSPQSASDAIPLQDEPALRQRAMELLRDADRIPRPTSNAASDPREESLADILVEKYRRIGLKL